MDSRFTPISKELSHPLEKHIELSSSKNRPSYNYECCGFETCSCPTCVVNREDKLFKDFENGIQLLEKRFNVANKVSYDDITPLGRLYLSVFSVFWLRKHCRF